MAKMSRIERSIVNSRVQLSFYRLAGMYDLFRHKELGRPRKILEIGCGVGRSTRELAKRFSKSRITAIDIDPAQLRKAPRLKNTTYRHADATNTGFDNSSFDAVYEFFTLHHIRQHRKAIKEAYRVLTPGGTFVIMDTALKWIDPFQLLSFRGLSYFRRSEIISTLEKTGFTVEHTRKHLHFTIIARKKA